jgi:hypothetical protein
MNLPVRPLLVMALSVLMATPGHAYKSEPVPVPAVENGYKATHWETLVPKDWNPYEAFKDLRSKGRAIQDTDPEAMDLSRKMREIWDNAPTNPAMNGAKVRLPGYVVPLEETRDGLKEFLLVPYFGACIHVPPPPANQIIHVVSDRPLKDVHSMDAVWVSGTLKTVRQDSEMGKSGYQMQAVAVKPYEERR